MRGEEVDDIAIKRILRESDDADERLRSVGGVQDRGRCGRGRRTRARSPAQRGSSLARLSRLVRALDRRHRARREQAVRDPGRLRRARRPSRSHAGSQLSTSVWPRALHAAPRSFGRGTTPTRSSRKRHRTVRSTSTRCSVTGTSSSSGSAPSRASGSMLPARSSEATSFLVPASASTPSASTWTATATSGSS